MPRRSLFPVVVALAACGGGGSATVSPQASTEARLAAANVEIGPAATGVDLEVDLVSVPNQPPVLLQVAVELPAGLALPATDRLHAVAPLPDLAGDFKDNRFVVVAGDGHNVGAEPLAVGPLFRLRVVPATPRVPGTYTVRFTDLRAASRDGEAPVPVTTVPTSVDVVVH
jgi:hypothetical protein